MSGLKGMTIPPRDFEEEALAAAQIVRAQRQELETLRAQLRLAQDEERLDKRRRFLQAMVDATIVKNKLQNETIEDFRVAYNEVARRLNSMVVMSGLREDSAWFRFGRWIGFYT